MAGKRPANTFHLWPRKRSGWRSISGSVRTVSEERQVPPLLHARLSVVLTRELYGVTGTDALQAIRFHTPLHAHPTPLNRVVFLADKLEWDQGGLPPYHADLVTALEDGLEEGARWFLGWMALPQARLLIPHPDLRAAWTAFDLTSPA